MPDMTETEHKRRRRIPLQGLVLLLSGAGIGWLIGLSASPVLQVLVAGILTLVVGVTSALAGIEVSEATPVPTEAEKTTDAPPPRRRINRQTVTPVPLALCVLGIVLGASLGVYGRTHEWLGADPQSLARKWHSTGLTDQEISRRLFDQLYPPSPPAEKVKKPESTDKPEKPEAGGGEGASKSHSGVLFTGVSADECTEFKSVSGPDLRRLMLASQNARVRKFAQQCKDDASLKAAVEDLVCQDAP